MGMEITQDFTWDGCWFHGFVVEIMIEANTAHDTPTKGQNLAAGDAHTVFRGGFFLKFMLKIHLNSFVSSFLE